MHAPDPVLKSQIRQRFDRASRVYHKHNQIQTDVLDDLISFVEPPIGTLLDLGCGPGIAAPLLSRLCTHYVAVDLSEAMLRQCPVGQTTIRIQADMDQLPIATDSVDCVFSNLAAQWSHSPQTLLSEMVRVSRQEGQIIVSTVLDGSLEPLNTLRRSLDGFPLANRQLTYTDWQRIIHQTDGVRIVSMMNNTYSLFTDNLTQLLASIRGVGAGARNDRPALTRQQLARLEDLYENARTPHGLPLHYTVGLFVLERIQAD